MAIFFESPCALGYRHELVFFWRFSRPRGCVHYAHYATLMTVYMYMHKTFNRPIAHFRFNSKIMFLKIIVVISLTTDKELEFNFSIICRYLNVVKSQ